MPRMKKTIWEMRLAVLFPSVCVALRRRRLVRELSFGFVAGHSVLFRMSDRPRAGFFSHFFQVLGLADLCRARRQSFTLNFHSGPFADPARESSWWANYFQPAGGVFGKAPDTTADVQNLQDQYQLAHFGADLPPFYARRLMRAMGLTINEVVARRVARYHETYMRGHTVTGVHYRGTDKVDSRHPEAVRVPPEFVVDHLRQNVSDTFFVATDEQAFLDTMVRQFPGRVLWCDVRRGSDGVPPHHARDVASPYQLGEEALVDSLLLSRCNRLVRTDSNLSLASRMFNPTLPTVNITDCYRRANAE